MRRAQNGDRVTVHYIGTLDNGRIFDQRDGDDPLSFVLGNGDVFPAMEAQIVGMKVGEVKNIHLAAEQAYGPRRGENLLHVSRQIFPADRELRVGQQLRVEFGGKEQRLMRVRRTGKQTVLLDGNHDLAGCDLTFAVQLVSIG
jgi:FKBP-type peptidyl-prolyl cis-trans isomerase 2